MPSMNESILDQQKIDSINHDIHQALKEIERECEKDDDAAITRNTEEFLHLLDDMIESIHEITHSALESGEDEHVPA